ncbi:hypothetical protein COBT_002624 [Conglomerata obtusa]
MLFKNEVVDAFFYTSESLYFLFRNQHIILQRKEQVGHKAGHAIQSDLIRHPFIADVLFSFTQIHEENYIDWIFYERITKIDNYNKGLNNDQVQSNLNAKDWLMDLGCNINELNAHTVPNRQSQKINERHDLKKFSLIFDNLNKNLISNNNEANFKSYIKINNYCTNIESENKKNKSASNLESDKKLKSSTEDKADISNKVPTKIKNTSKKIANIAICDPKKSNIKFIDTYDYYKTPERFEDCISLHINVLENDLNARSEIKFKLAIYVSISKLRSKMRDDFSYEITHDFVFSVKDFYYKIIELYNNLKSANNPAISKTTYDKEHFGVSCRTFPVGNGNYGFTRRIGLFYGIIHKDDIYNVLKMCKEKFTIPRVIENREKRRKW